MRDADVRPAVHFRRGQLEMHGAREGSAVSRISWTFLHVAALMSDGVEAQVLCASSANRLQAPALSPGPLSCGRARERTSSL